MVYLATLFCCLPFGIAAIISSTKVDTLYTTGQYAEANAAAASAKKWIMRAVGGALAVLLAYLLFFVVLASASSGY